MTCLDAFSADGALPFEERGNPRFGLLLPRAHTVSSQGHAVPFVHPRLWLARPQRWPYSRRRWMLLALSTFAPLLAGSLLTLKLLNWREPVRLTGMSLRLQRLVYRTVTRYQDDWSRDPVQVGVVFPGEVAAWPVDVGILEPLVVLNAMGVTTAFSCEGHPGGGAAYIGLAPGNNFPPCMLKALTAAGVRHYVEFYDDRGAQALYARDEAAQVPFAATLRAWARRKAIGLFATD